MRVLGDELRHIRDMSLIKLEAEFLNLFEEDFKQRSKEGFKSYQLYDLCEEQEKTDWIDKHLHVLKDICKRNSIKFLNRPPNHQGIKCEFKW